MVAAAVIGTLIAIAAVIGAIVGVFCYLKGSKEGRMDTHKTIFSVPYGKEC